MKFKYGRVYNEGQEVKINSMGGIFLYDDTGVYHHSMAKIAIEEMLKNLWMKKLSNGRHLFIYEGEAFVSDRYFELKRATWNYVMEHLSGDIYDSDELPEL